MHLRVQFPGQSLVQLDLDQLVSLLLLARDQLGLLLQVLSNAHVDLFLDDAFVDALGEFAHQGVCFYRCGLVNSSSWALGVL